MRSNYEESNNNVFGFQDSIDKRLKIIIDGKLDEKQIALSSFAITYIIDNSEIIPEKIDISSIFEHSLLNAAGYLIPSENFSILSKN